MDSNAKNFFEKMPYKKFSALYTIEQITLHT